MAFTLARHTAMTETAQGMVLLDERTGRYWQLNTTGAAVVKILLDGGSPQQAAAMLAARHPAAAERVAADVDRLVQALHQAQVVAP